MGGVGKVDEFLDEVVVVGCGWYVMKDVVVVWCVEGKGVGGGIVGYVVVERRKVG